MTKQTTKTAAKKTSKKVDYEPNKMTFAIAALAAVTLALLACIVTFS